MSEPVHDREVIVRPNDGAGWRVEFPRQRGTGAFVVVVKDELFALRLAKSLGQQAEIRVIHDQERGL